jgi:hypothetical protein
MGTASAESSLFDQTCETGLSWQVAIEQRQRGKVRTCLLTRPRATPPPLVPPRRREEDSERWDGLA